MGYRADFEKLIGGIFESIKVTRIDHDPRSKEGNKPDFVVVSDVPIVYIETKDIGISLDKVEKSSQMSLSDFSINSRYNKSITRITGERECL